MKPLILVKVEAIVILVLIIEAVGIYQIAGVVQPEISSILCWVILLLVMTMTCQDCLKTRVSFSYCWSGQKSSNTHSVV